MHAGQAEKIEKIVSDSDDSELKEADAEEEKEKDDKKKSKKQKIDLHGFSSEKETADFVKKNPSFFNEGMNCGCGNDPCDTYGKNGEKIIIMVKEEIAKLEEEFGDDSPFRMRDMVSPKVRGKFKDTFTKVPGAEGSLSGGKISKMPKAKAAWKAAGGELSVFDKESIAKFLEDADLDISLEKYMDNIEYAIKGNRLGRRIYSLRDALALANPTGSRRGHIRTKSGPATNQAPEFTRESMEEDDLKQVIKEEIQSVLDEKKKKKKKSAKDRMKCNSSRRIRKGEPGYGKKKFVVKACEGGTEKIIRYGDANMEIKKDSPARRKSFRARHNCKNPGSKLKARYWSCKKW